MAVQSTVSPALKQTTGPGGHIARGNASEWSLVQKLGAGRYCGEAKDLIGKEHYKEGCAPDKKFGRHPAWSEELMPRADVFIQAGHEGRTEGATGAVGPLGNEIDWNPVVADEATRILKEAGVSVIREDETLDDVYEVALAQVEKMSPGFGREQWATLL
jgi:hypothetical protein